MYVVAIIGDLLSLIPGVNIVSGIITAMLLWIAGEISGVQIFSSSRIGGTLLTILIEEIPVLAMLPAWTIRVYFAKKAAKEAEEQASQ